MKQAKNQIIAWVLFTLGVGVPVFGQDNGAEWKAPRVVNPGSTASDCIQVPPSDAIILFDGKDLAQFETTSGGVAGWEVKDGVFTVAKKAGDIRTRKEFSDFQLHIEWRIPENIEGAGQLRGNSGIFLQGKYEIQILDSYNNETYFNGQAGSVYSQMPPLVNAMRIPGEWNVYDIIYTAPTFKGDGTFRTRPSVTILHNGVLVQNNTTIMGITFKDYKGYPPGELHGAGPIVLQDHGFPVSFRNVWIREL
jgi:hypothetical protein